MSTVKVTRSTTIFMWLNSCLSDVSSVCRRRYLISSRGATTALQKLIMELYTGPFPENLVMLVGWAWNHHSTEHSSTAYEILQSWVSAPGAPGCLVGKILSGRVLFTTVN